MSRDIRGRGGSDIPNLLMRVNPPTRKMREMRSQEFMILLPFEIRRTRISVKIVQRCINAKTRTPHRRPAGRQSTDNCLCTRT
jgi:hypothetical protein